MLDADVIGEQKIDRVSTKTSVEVDAISLLLQRLIHKGLESCAEEPAEGRNAAYRCSVGGESYRTDNQSLLEPFRKERVRQDQGASSPSSSRFPWLR